MGNESQEERRQEAMAISGVEQRNAAMKEMVFRDMAAYNDGEAEGSATLDLMRDLVEAAKTDSPQHVIYALAMIKLSEYTLQFFAEWEEENG